MPKSVLQFFKINWKMKVLYWLWIWVVLSLFLALELENDIIQTNNWLIQTEQQFNKDIETAHRTTARYMAKAIGLCIKSRYNEHKFENLEEMTKIISECGAEHRSWWLTWDFFVFDRVSRTMVFDGSSDCMKGWEWRPFDFIFEKNNKKEVGECWMHKDKWLCIQAIEKLYSIWDTDYNSNIYILFDEDFERLESSVIPSLSNWFKGKLWAGGVFSLDNLQLQIVMWTQKDEVMAHYQPTISKYTELKNNTNEVNAKINFILWSVVILSILMFFFTTLILKQD